MNNTVHLAGFEIENMKEGEDFPYLRKYTGTSKLDESIKVILDVLKIHKKLHNPFLIQFFKEECLLLEAEVNQKLKSSGLMLLNITDIKKKITNLSKSYRDYSLKNRPYYAQEKMAFMNPYMFDKNRVYFKEMFIGEEKKAKICDRKVVSVEEHEKLIENNESQNCKTVCVMSNKLPQHKYKDFFEKFHLKEVENDCQEVIDILICGAEIDEKNIMALRYENIISDIWLMDSMTENYLITPFRWYHNFFPKNTRICNILLNENVVVTNYIESERNCIQNLVTALGGNYSNSFSALTFPILISETALGRKCESAIKNNLPILKVEWLIKCYKNQLRCDETDYLVGGKESRFNKGRRNSVIPGSFDVDEQEASSESVDTELTDFFEELEIAVSPALVKKLEFVKWKNKFANDLLESLREEDKNEN